MTERWVVRVLAVFPQLIAMNVAMSCRKVVRSVLAVGPPEAGNPVAQPLFRNLPIGCNKGTSRGFPPTFLTP